MESAIFQVHGTKSVSVERTAFAGSEVCPAYSTITIRIKTSGAEYVVTAFDNHTATPIDLSVEGC